MRYFIYNATGNRHQIDAYIALYEIADDGQFTRSIDILPSAVLKYSQQHEADNFGQLPEGPWNDAEAVKPEYGSLSAITHSLFESAWNSFVATNVPRGDA